MRPVFSLAAAVALIAGFILPGAVAASSSPCGATTMINQWTIQFPSGFWSSGVHTYSIRIVDTYPGDEFDFTDGPWSFTVSDEAPLYPGNVQVASLGGYVVSLPQLTLVLDYTINPAQSTLYQSMMFWDMTATTVANAKAEVADTAAYFQYDGGPWITAHAWPLTGYCATLTPANQGGAFTGYFHRSWGRKFLVE